MSQFMERGYVGEIYTYIEREKEREREREREGGERETFPPLFKIKYVV